MVLSVSVAVAYLLSVPLACASASSWLPSSVLLRVRPTGLRSLRRSLLFASTSRFSPPHGDQLHGSSLVRYSPSRSVPRQCHSQRRPTGFGTGVLLMPVSLFYFAGARPGPFLSKLGSTLLGRLWPRKFGPRHQSVLHLGHDVFYVHRFRVLLHSGDKGPLS
jgi:hypothetical protein